MVQLGGRAGLGLETASKSWVGCQTRVQQLDRNPAMKREVFGQIDTGRPATPDRSNQAIPLTEDSANMLIDIRGAHIVMVST